MLRSRSRLFNGLVIVLLTIAGFQDWSFLLSVVLGACAQTTARLAGRYWTTKTSSKVKPETSADGEKPVGTPNISAVISTFLVMVIVSVIWYFVGVLGLFVFNFLG